jgi:hypothetical protein
MSFDEDSYGIGTAQQYPSGGDRLDLENLPAFLSGADRLDLENLPDVFGSAGTPRGLLYSNEAYGPGMTGAQTSRYDTVLNLTGSKDLANLAASGGFTDFFKNLGSAAGNIGSSRMGMAGLAALFGLLDRARPSGGGAKQGMMAPRQYTRSVVPGATGTPIVRYAANGGLMQAYASGGAVRPFPMQDGGFVMTKKAVDGAEKLADGGITSLLPDAKMIRGPGTGTSDDIPAYIQGPNGRTPAKLSNGEAYVPPGRDTKGLYALMHKLERKA